MVGAPSVAVADFVAPCLIKSRVKGGKILRLRKPDCAMARCWPIARRTGQRRRPGPQMVGPVNGVPAYEPNERRGNLSHDMQFARVGVVVPQRRECPPLS